MCITEGSLALEGTSHYSECLILGKASYLSRELRNTKMNSFVWVEYYKLGLYHILVWVEYYKLGLYHIQKFIRRGCR